MKTLNIALCEGRHEIPQATDGAIFRNEIDPRIMRDETKLESQAYWGIWEACFKHDKNGEQGWLIPSEEDPSQSSVPKDLKINLYVTGLTVALVGVINLCKDEKIDLTLFHYDRDKGDYFPQEIYKENTTREALNWASEHNRLDIYKMIYLQERDEKIEMKKDLWIIPPNDLEAKTSVAFCEKNNIPYMTTDQAWGASWSKVEPEIISAAKEVIQNGGTVYGFELAGEAPFAAVNIDHHVYDGDDRSNSMSSIEQLADRYRLTLDRNEMLIAANDKGYIPAMREYSATREEIDNIRLLDRKSQGITEEQEAQATKALDSMKKNPETGLFTVEMPHSKCATITDRLFGQYDNLLIKSEDGEINFYGKGSVCKELQQEFGGWSGGDLENSGFWGATGLNQNEVERFVDTTLQYQQLREDVGNTSLDDLFGEEQKKENEEIEITPLKENGEIVVEHEDHGAEGGEIEDKGLGEKEEEIEAGE